MINLTKLESFKTRVREFKPQCEMTVVQSAQINMLKIRAIIHYEDLAEVLDDGVFQLEDSIFSFMKKSIDVALGKKDVSTTKKTKG